MTLVTIKTPTPLAKYNPLIHPRRSLDILAFVSGVGPPHPHHPTHALYIPHPLSSICFLQAEAVFTVGEAFRGDHKAALAALSSTTTLQFEYLDALLRPSQGSPSAASLFQGAETGRDKKSRGGRRWGGTSPERVTGRSSRAPPALAAGLDERDRSLHIRLLVKFRPYEVYPFLSGSTG